MHPMRLIPLLLLLWSPALHAAPSLSAAHKATLSKGEVVIVTLPTSSGVKAWAARVIRAPKEAVWPTVRDCAHFSKFMPRTKASRMVRKTGEKMICEVEISMPFPLSNLKATTTAVNTTLPGDAGYKRTWKLLEGNYKRNQGSWDILPWGADTTLAVYNIDVDPDMLVPDAILRKAQTGSLPDVFKAIEKRAQGR